MYKTLDEESNAKRRIVITKTSVKLSVKIEPKRYINNAPNLNAKKKNAATGWLIHKNKKRSKNQWF